MSMYGPMWSLEKNWDERKIFVNGVLMLYPGQILQQKQKKWTAVLPAIVNETLSLNGYAFIQFKFSINWLPVLLLPIFLFFLFFSPFFEHWNTLPICLSFAFVRLFFLLNAPNCRKGNQKSWKFSEKATSIKICFDQSETVCNSWYK